MGVKGCADCAPQIALNASTVTATYLVSNTPFAPSAILSSGRDDLVLGRYALQFRFFRQIMHRAVAANCKVKYVDMADEWNQKGIPYITHIRDVAHRGWEDRPANNGHHQ